MRIFGISAALFVVLAGYPGLANSQEPNLVAVDENLWVTFYDVPSHRFRSIRDEFVRREFASVRRNLITSASHLMIESGRSSPELAVRLDEVATQMNFMADDISDPSITTESLDRLFGRSHWLLAQHYLFHARNARDASNNRMAGRYLWAATHHMERAVLWSNGRIDRKLVNTLDGLRSLAVRLQDDKDAAAARSERPIRRAETALVAMGALIDRPVVLEIE